MQGRSVKRKRYRSDIPADAPARAKGTARARALDLAKKQQPDKRIVAVLTVEGFGSLDRNRHLVAALRDDLELMREAGLAYLEDDLWNHAEQSTDGKSRRSRESLLQHYAGHRPAAQNDGMRDLVALLVTPLTQTDEGMSHADAQALVRAKMDEHPGLGVTDLVPLVVGEVERRLAA